jgi:lipoate-protein ligase A
MIWQSSPSVIIGKHQNILSEVNLEFVTKRKVPVIRRISGGGTVYHDEGNINYTVITSEKNRERLIDFKKFTQPIIEFLKTFNIDAKYEGKNNLAIKGIKISGNAAHVYKNRVMHHGTLLFSSNLELLDKAILQSKINIKDKAVQSIRATVGNISDFLPVGIKMDDFKEKLVHFLIDFHSIKKSVVLSEKQMEAISKIADEKYRKWDWNYGYSPTFTLKNKTDNLDVELQIKNGLIQEAKLTGSFAGIEQLNSALIGVAHNPVALKKVAESFVSQHQVDQLIKLFGFYKT